MKTSVAQEELESMVVAEQYYVFPGTVCTVCCLTLKNGFTVVGSTAPVYPGNFTTEAGEKIARENAIDKIWQLEGYLLKQRLSDMGVF